MSNTAQLLILFAAMGLFVLWIFWMAVHQVNMTKDMKEPLFKLIKKYTQLANDSKQFAEHLQCENKFNLSLLYTARANTYKQFIRELERILSDTNN